MHLDPGTLARPALFGVEGGGYYLSLFEKMRWYFDMPTQSLAGKRPVDTLPLLTETGVTIGREQTKLV